MRGRDLEGGIEREDFYTWKFTRFCTESLVVRPSYKCNFVDRLATKIIFLILHAPLMFAVLRNVLSGYIPEWSATAFVS